LPARNKNQWSYGISSLFFFKKFIAKALTLSRPEPIGCSERRRGIAKSLIGYLKTCSLGYINDLIATISL
ncbi:MAG: hypothetical protein AB8B70_07320, partial [Prochlorococcus sp.]